MIIRMLCLMFALTLVACDREGTHWEEAQQENTIAAYEAYVESYPAGENADQARNLIDTLRAEEAWTQVQQQDTMTAYRGFLADYPDAAGVDEARARLDILEREDAWQDLATSDDIAALQNFADEHPNSPEAEIARTRANELEAEAERRELEAQAEAERERELELQREREREAQRQAEQGTHRVQLAAVRSQDQANAGIEQLQRQLGEVLGDIGLEAQRTNGLYRLVTQAMSREEAGELCGALNQRGQDCFVRQR